MVDQDSGKGARGKDAHLRLLVEESPVAMGIVSRAGEIEYANPAFSRLYGEKLARSRNVVEFVQCATLDPAEHERALDYWHRQVWSSHGDHVEPSPYVGRIETPGGTRDVVCRSLVVGDKVLVVINDITEHTGLIDLDLANKALQESETKYRQLHDSMSDAFVRVDLSGRIVEVNQAFEALVGYTAEELSHLTYVDLTPERWHAAEARIVEEHILPYGCSEVYEKEYQCKDGTIIPVELRTFLIRDSGGEPASMWAIVRDITARRRLEEALRQSNKDLESLVEERTAKLRQSEARFQQLAEASLEGIAVSANGILIDVNTQFAEMLGRDVSELIGHAAVDFVAPGSRELVARRREEGYEGRYECDAIRKDGSTLPCEVCGRTTEWLGREVRITVIRDLTESKRVEVELAAQRQDLAGARRIAIRSEISAGVLHQIGQPITSIWNNVAAARIAIGNCGQEHCGAADFLLDVEAELGRIRTTMDHLRMLAHTEHQNRTQADLNDLLEGVLGRTCAGTECQDVRVILDLHPELPRISVDPVQMVQALGNLTRNACHAVTTLPPEERVVTIAARISGPGHVEITVRDAGPGILPDDLPRVFDPFFTTKEAGMGIGLSLVRRIVEGHGGRVDGFNNEPGPGATFRINLPVGEGGAR